MKFSVAILSVFVAVGMVSGHDSSPAIEVTYKNGVKRLFAWAQCIPARDNGAPVDSAVILKSSTCYTYRDISCGGGDALDVPIPFSSAIGTVTPIPNAADFAELIAQSAACFQNRLP